MHKALSLIAVHGFLAAVGSMAPVYFANPLLDVFARVRHGYHFESDNDDAVVYLPLTWNRVMADLYAMMQELINKEMTTTCKQD